jgi:exosome complex component RRP4
VIPGETIVTGTEYLPGDYTMRHGNEIVAIRFGLSDISGRLVKVIPLAGVYVPRKGNAVIGKVIDLTFNGWILDINAPYQAFLPVAECMKYINKNDLTEYLDIGDMVVAEVLSVKHRGIDLTLKARGLGKLEEGMIMFINSNKVPRVIGREGSMINLIKKETGCSIIVGQNGLIWLRGKTIEAELFAKEAITFVVEKSFVEGLTEKAQEFLTKRSKEAK